MCLDPLAECLQPFLSFLTLEGRLAVQLVDEREVVVRSVFLFDEPAVLHLQGGSSVDGEPAQYGERVAFFDIQLLEAEPGFVRGLDAVDQQGSAVVFQVKAAAGGASYFFHHALDQITGGICAGKLQEFAHAQLPGLGHARQRHKQQGKQDQSFHEDKYTTFLRTFVLLDKRPYLYANY